MRFDDPVADKQTGEDRGRKVDEITQSDSTLKRPAWTWV